MVSATVFGYGIGLSFDELPAYVAMAMHWLLEQIRVDVCQCLRHI